MTRQKIFRLFISSTFKDLIAERNYLQKEIFPKLENLCESHGTKFQAVDLRWGVSEQDNLDQKGLEICLNELRRCQEYCVKPNFIVILGERYGWLPVPTEIEEKEFELLRQYMKEEDKKVIEFWYKLDKNENNINPDGMLSSHYELAPRRGEHSDFADYQKWSAEEKKIHEILLDAANKADLEQDKKFKYYASATHQEILEGALSPDVETGFAHAFFRTTNGLPKDASESIFRTKNAEHKARLNEIKQALRQKLGNCCYEYSVDLSNEQETELYLQEFGKDVYEAFERNFLDQLADMEHVTEYEAEEESALNFAESRAKIFIGREKYISDIKNYISSEHDNSPFILVGEPGSGKSALMSKVFQLSKSWFPNAEIICRFIGTSNLSSNSYNLLTHIGERITEVYNGPFLELPRTYDDLIVYFKEKLSLVSKEKPLILILDAIDQFNKKDLARDLRWLPDQLPANVKIVTSIATDAIDVMDALKHHFQRADSLLSPLSLDEGKTILNMLLKATNRALLPHQFKEVMDKFVKNKGNPLYLKLAFEQSKLWNSYDPPEKTVLGDTTEDVILQLFAKLEYVHGRMLVDRALSYIALSRYGLSET
ncbi:MAG: DUF4062 domain-containing protein, partial [Candidatus Lokiarchaeota archaeon]|nr:DUF4062 domain-containing protein [Candidatus Lokiarchaeota archaeon]